MAVMIYRLSEVDDVVEKFVVLSAGLISVLIYDLLVFVDNMYVYYGRWICPLLCIYVVRKIVHHYWLYPFMVEGKLVFYYADWLGPVVRWSQYVPFVLSVLFIVLALVQYYATVAVVG